MLEVRTVFMWENCGEDEYCRFWYINSSCRFVYLICIAHVQAHTIWFLELSLYLWSNLDSKLLVRQVIRYLIRSVKWGRNALIIIVQRKVRWPWELTALQLKTTHAKRKNTSTLRKIHQVFNTCTAFRKCSAKTTTQRKCFQRTLKCDAHVRTRLLLTLISYNIQYNIILAYISDLLLNYR